ncbi:MAG TPA: F0F1 ATP synthase subunit gamma [Methylophaga aminisulfidivorans]|uniref:F0F1 ATP synthase subunit gamma n=1 Tax=Methylophaga aminisulfidivorans TaxID=230105 RepID=A0A7C1W0F8_9GAMM|nr:F0F1 ATP synthase subunit gamma [Methylophaga aminisulfidivorans]
MTETATSLRHKIVRADDLDAVVRTMKAMAASSIGQYEMAVNALEDYYHAIQLGLSLCLDDVAPYLDSHTSNSKPTVFIVFGSDQGLVGQFNAMMADFVHTEMDEHTTSQPQFWTIGERIKTGLEDQQCDVSQHFDLPVSISAITQLIGELVIHIDAMREQDEVTQFYVFHHQPVSASRYKPVKHRLLPFDKAWHQQLKQVDWPSQALPEVLGNNFATLGMLIREFLFVSLYKACAESLASENASRLAAMQRAEENIEALQDSLHKRYHRLRQENIDEELSDVIQGYEALKLRR